MAQKVSVGVLVAAVAITAILVGAGVYFVTYTPPPAELEEVVFMMDWAPKGEFAPFYVALDQGYYEDEGLEVTIVRGYGATKTVAAVDMGQAQFATAEINSIMMDIVAGGDVRIVAGYFDVCPVGLSYITEWINITEPKDLEGTTIGLSAWTAARDYLPDFCRINNVDYDSIEIVTVDIGSRFQLLLGGEYDATSGWITGGTIELTHAAEEEGYHVGSIWFKDWGLDVYGKALFTTNELIENKPEVVRGFVAATVKGYEFTHLYPEDAADIVLKHEPELFRDIVLDQVEKWTTVGSADGTIDEAKMHETIDILNDVFDIEPPAAYEDVYTTDFIPTE